MKPYDVSRSQTMRAVALGMLCLSPTLAFAGGTRKKTIEGFDDLDAGETDGAAIEGSGKVSVGMTSARTTVENAKVAFTCLSDGARAFVGTSDEAAIFRVTAGAGSGKGATSKVERLAALSGVVVSAIEKLPGGDLVAATLPGGEIFRVDAKGKVSSFAKLDVEQIWALQVHKGRLLAATGPKGELWSLALDGTGARVVLDSSEKDLLSMIEVDGEILVGTSPGANILQLSDAESSGRLIHDFEGDEVRSMAVSGSMLVAAVNSFDSREVTSVTNMTKQLARASLTGDAPASSTVTASEPKADAKLVAVSLANASKGNQRDLGRALESTWETWLDKKRQYFTSVVAQDDKGTVLVATSQDAKIYRVRGRRDVATIADLQERRAASLCRLDGGRMLAGTGDGASVYTLTSAAADKGRWISKVLDSDQASEYGEITVHGDGKLKLRVRVGPSDTPDDRWSPWTEVPLRAGEPDLQGQLKVALRRYVQFEVSLSGSDAVFEGLTYFYAPENLPPVIKSVDVSAPKFDVDDIAEPKAQAKIKWTAEARDDDELAYQVRMRKQRDGDDAWFRLHSDERITSKELELDLTTVPDGVYEVEVQASDEPSNGTARAQSDIQLSSPFLVDRTRPRVDSATVAKDRLTGTVSDESSRISDVAFSIDGGPFRRASASDGIFDQSKESFEITLPQLDSGTHRIVVRVRDAAGNIGVRALIVRR